MHRYDQSIQASNSVSVLESLLNSLPDKKEELFDKYVAFNQSDNEFAKHIKKSFINCFNKINV